MSAEPAYVSPASYHRCAERVQTKWSQFLATREDRLRQQARHGMAMENTAEAILEDLFTQVPDWRQGDLDDGVGQLVEKHLASGHGAERL